MVTDNHYRWDFIGLSTDTKPTPETSPKVVNGSTYYCSDTSKLYVWYKDQWYERKPLGGGGGGGTDDFDQLDNRPKYNGALMTGSTDIPEVINYTAGSNITISSDGEISATDTTYSNFTGTDGTAAGTAGLVPAPSILDTDKYLKSDGTWASVSGGGASYTAGDGIDITNSVISATNTGKARELTIADYNWPVANPAGVALWLLPDGIYHNQDNVRLYENTGSYLGSALSFQIYTRLSQKFFLVYQEDGRIKTTKISEQSSTQYEDVLLNSDIKNNLTTSSSYHAVLSANQGRVLKNLVDSLAIRGAGAPTTSTAGEVGTLYEDTTNGDLYICTDATNPYVWEEVGAGGSGSAVVQTTGTSTTDVMSQNAVTGMIYLNPGTNTKIRIGSDANALGTYSIAIGRAASGQLVAGSTVSIGNTAAATADGAIALGATSNASQRGEMNIGSTSTSFGYNNSNYRLLTGLYAPQSAHDAVNKEYVDPTTDSSAPTASTAGRLGEIRIDTTDNSAYMCVVSVSTTPAYEWKKITA